ncbi:DUF2339 domain-containing protein [Pelagibacterium sp.]|uniref:DUF2339 domain-containing protein n=1 Tax=Pelagibacterium sp. TaxID=1967288 RepID=UPI003A8D3A13
MEDILLIAVLVLAVMAFIAHRDIKDLKKRLAVFEGDEGAADTPRAAPASASTPKVQPESAATRAPVAQTETENDGAAWASNVAQGPWMRAQASAAANEPVTRAKVNWEHMLGVRLPVWGGAALLLFAAFLFANYAMEQGVFTPAVRVWACGLGAGAFLAVALLVRQRRIANFERISGALASVAIGLGYATCYLATAVFQFWPPVFGAMGSWLVGLTAIAIAVIFGRLVLVLGLLGGYLAPFFLGDMPDGWTLVGYLCMVLVASHAVAASRGWWTSALFSSGLALLWGLGWAYLSFEGAQGGDGLPLTFWVLAIAIVPVAAERIAPQDEGTLIMRRDGPVAAAVGSALALVLMGIEMQSGNPFWPGFVAWIAFLAAASVFWPQRMNLGWLALGGLAGALLVWRDPEPGVRVGVLIAALPIVLGVAWVHIAAGRRQRIWASAAMAIAMLAVLTSLVDLDGWAGARDVPQMWAAIAVGLAIGLAGLLFALRGTKTSTQIAPPLAAAASGLISVAIGLIVEPGYFALSASLQVAGLGLVFWRYRAVTLLYLALIYVVAYLALVAFGHGAAIGLMPALSQWPYGQFIPVVALEDAPWLALIVPGLALLVGASLFALAVRDRLIAVIDLVGVLVVALGVHVLIAPAFDADPIRMVFVFGPAWFGLEFAIGAAAVWGAARFERAGLLWSGVVVAGLAGMALIRLALVPVAEFWPAMDVPGIAVFNLATLTLGLSSALLVVIGRLLAMRNDQGWHWAGLGFYALGGVSVFVAMLLAIRHGFHPDLLQGETLRIERYAYTGGMLAFAFALLWLGTARNAQAIRFASLGVALATVGKLFIFDMGGLEGLWRIGSFLGLGLALLGVSWFYARFVFGLGSGVNKDGGMQQEATPAGA